MQRIMKRWIMPVLALTATAGLGIAGYAMADHHGGGDGDKAPKADIVETAVAAGSFKTLAAALQAAGLVETLQGDGPFTVLAPTDEAFAKLPAGTVESLLKPENKAKLVNILTLHVVSGRVSAVDAIRAGEADALNGDALSFGIKDGRVQVNGVDVIGTDIQTSNGVIHVLDAVLLPEMPKVKAKHTDAASPRQLIDMAIERGVPLFNGGQPAACAAVYEVAIAALVDDTGMSASQRRLAQMSFAHGAEMHDAHARAWAYRKTLDKLRSQLVVAEHESMAMGAE